MRDTLFGRTGQREHFSLGVGWKGNVPGVGSDTASLRSPAEQDSLKRKRSPTPETTEPVAPPLKRRKTPEPEASKETAVLTEEETVCQTLPPTNPDSTLAAPTGAPYDEDCQTGPCEIVQSSTMPEPTEPSLDKEPRSPIGEPPLSHPETASPDTCACGARPPVVLPTPTSSWSSLGTIVAVKPSTAFREFSGTSTAFASVFSAAAQRSPGPVWSMTDGDVTANQTASDPLAAHSYATSTQTIVTGEEDESASTELKGAKVFIKRGDRDFCEGILGHAKLLKHRQTGAERLLFRREPVMKVSVNVRMHPLVRCSFDETQGLLRVTLKEPVEDTQLEHIVVYALKRGKASRAEFAEFAKAVMSSAQSHSRVQDPAPSSTPSYPSEPPAV
ncbi:hypothetical protein C8Q79DRAFT_1013894 [Trametes meyenii]|nr:hypothetical protein C8Q79DRAFT_1013894 [Trametes meyenii]